MPNVLIFKEAPIELVTVEYNTFPLHMHECQFGKHYPVGEGVRSILSSISVDNGTLKESSVWGVFCRECWRHLTGDPAMKKI